ncbi:MAG: aldo/keto reductase, partial [Chthonomonadales bacterium]
MLRRRFGRTELDLSVLSFGAMRILPEADEDPDANLDRALKTLRRAMDIGINHIETARGYGLSEELIGKALAQGVIKRDEFYLTTKIGPKETAAEFMEALVDSMARMGVDYVDNLDIHGINLQEHIDMCLKPGGCMDAVRAAMADGRVGHIGFSTHGQLNVIIDAIKTDLFESVNLHYYYINQRNRPAVLEAIARDMGIYIISPTDKGGQLFNPPARLQELCAPYTPIEFNQRWLLSQPEVHTLSLGAATPEEFEPHRKMASVDGPLTGEELVILEKMEAAMRGV